MPSPRQVMPQHAMQCCVSAACLWSVSHGWLARSPGLELLRLFMDLAYYRAFGRLWALGLGCLGWLGYDRGIEG
jgi:hypothetical protein